MATSSSYFIVQSLLALAALLVIISLWFRLPIVARLLHDLALAMTILAPFGFIALTFITLSSQPTFANYDITKNYEGAQQLYALGLSPYTVSDAVSFPFPTFFIYWLLSGFGVLTLTPTWLVLSTLNITLWGLCVVLLRPTLTIPRSTEERRLRWYIIAAVPLMLTIWWGQTAIIILVGLTLLHLAGQNNRHWPTWVVGGLGLGVATLIKPQIGLVGVGVAVWGLLAYRDHRPEDVCRVIVILVSAEIVVCSLIGLTILIPDGVTLDLYVQFFRDVLPGLNRSDIPFNPNIGTFAYVLPRVALSLGLSDQLATRFGDVLSLAVVLVALVWTYQRRHRPLYEIAAGWGAWAILVPRIASNWYAAWCLPFFLLSLQESRSKGRAALIIITLALLNMQAGVLVLSFATILLFGYLVWTSFTGQTALA